LFPGRLSLAFSTLPFVCRPLVTPKSRDSSVGIAMGYGLEGQGPIPGRSKIFLLTAESRTALRPTRHPIQWVPRALSQRVKRLGCEADHSPPSNADAKNGGAIPPLPHTSSWSRDNFPFSSYLWPLLSHLCVRTILGQGFSNSVLQQPPNITHAFMRPHLCTLLQIPIRVYGGNRSLNCVLCYKQKGRGFDSR
jgi:hypothetical protein